MFFSLLFVLIFSLLGSFAQAGDSAQPTSTSEGPYELPFVDVSKMAALVSPTIPGPGKYSNDHTVIKGGDGKWHVIGIIGGGSGSEVSFYHTILEQIDPPKKLIGGTKEYPNVSVNGEAPAIAALTDKFGNKCAAWAPMAIKNKSDGKTYLFFRSDRRPDGTCDYTKALSVHGTEHVYYRLEVLVSDDATLQNWTLINSYPTVKDPNASVEFNVKVSGTPDAYMRRGKDGVMDPAVNTGWPDSFRDPGLFEEGNGYLLYAPAFNWELNRSEVVAYKSSDLKEWTYAGSVLSTYGDAINVSWGSTESPFLFKRGDWYYLSTTITNSGSDSYHDTVVFRSKDPLNFGTYGGEEIAFGTSKVVARLPLHAPEYFEDGGQLYATTCGWEGMSIYPQAKQGVGIVPVNFVSTLPKNELTLRYDFNDVVASKQVTDLSGSAHNGTLENVATSLVAGGVIGNALSLAGDDTVEIADLPLNNDFTLAGWVKLESKDGNRGGLFHSKEGYEVNFDNGMVNVTLGDTVKPLTGLIQSGQWTHVALARSQGKVRLYVNGVVVAGGDWPGGALTLDSIGRTGSGTLKGLIDETRVYTRALTGLEINSLLNIEKPDLLDLVHASPAPAITRLAGDFTVSAWFNLAKDPSNSDGLFVGRSRKDDVNFYKGLPRFHTENKDLLTSETTVEKGVWTRVSLTRSGSTVSLYNGTEVKSTTWNEPLIISRIGDAIGGRTNGTVADFKILSKAQTADDVANEVKAGLLPSETTFNGDFTISAWVRLSRAPGNQDGLFVGRPGTDDLNFYGGKPRFYAGNTDLIVADQAVQQDTWTHIALTRSGKTVSLYNGNDVKTATWDKPLTITKVGEAIAGRTQGIISNLKILNRAQTASEVKADVDAEPSAQYYNLGVCGKNTVNPVCPY